MSKCEFLKKEMEYLGFKIGDNYWTPSTSKISALTTAEIKNLKDLRSFIGAANFIRRHVKNFTFSSHSLTDLTKKNARWTWTEKEQQKFEELKEKIKNIGYLGVPRSSGEIVMVTDASNIGGGATLFQWQKLTKDQVPEDLKTQGVNGDGKLKHNYPEEFFLVPLGHWNWKWNSTRRNYDTYEQELMAGVLTLASQKRIVSHLPIIWFTDQQPLKEFLKKDPPLKARLLRWYAFLSQLRLNIQHIPGLKNELCD